MDAQELKEHFLKEKARLEYYIDAHYKRLDRLNDMILEIEWAEKEKNRHEVEA